jgi:hypothetical protein
VSVRVDGCRTSLPAVVLLPIIIGACSVTPHPWQSPGNEQAVVVDTHAWPKIDRALQCLVDENQRAAAAALLAEAPAAPLSLEQAASFCRITAAPPQGWAPYLLRGAGASSVWCALVRYDPATRQAFVYETWYNGENLLMIGATVEANPVVAFLPSSPLQVHVVAQEHGDAIGGTECFRDEADFARRQRLDPTPVP